ncbi:MAG: hypothetical protein IKP72_13725 [Clostridia bacterium]|nr:hypothetical protein [Clostridia bacterium]
MEEGEKSIVFPYPKARGETAERPCHGTCPGEKHSTAHDALLKTNLGFGHPSRLPSFELTASYHNKPTMSIGKLTFFDCKIFLNSNFIQRFLGQKLQKSLE